MGAGAVSLTLTLMRVERMMWMALGGRRKIRVQVGNLVVEAPDGKALEEGGNER